jgi:hypothetical protein
MLLTVPVVKKCVQCSDGVLVGGADIRVVDGVRRDVRGRLQGAVCGCRVSEQPRVDWA